MQWVSPVFGSKYKNSKYVHSDIIIIIFYKL